MSSQPARLASTDHPRVAASQVPALVALLVSAHREPALADALAGVGFRVEWVRPDDDGLVQRHQRLSPHAVVVGWQPGWAQEPPRALALLLDELAERLAGPVAFVTAGAGIELVRLAARCDGRLLDVSRPADVSTFAARAFGREQSRAATTRRRLDRYHRAAAAITRRRSAPAHPEPPSSLGCYAHAATFARRAW